MTPDQFIDAVSDASNNPTPERIQRVRRALPVIGTRPGGMTFPRAMVDALWRRARGAVSGIRPAASSARRRVGRVGGLLPLRKV